MAYPATREVRRTGVAAAADPVGDMITIVVMPIMVRLSTAMAPTSPLSLRSKIRTDRTLVSEVNRMTAAVSSRMTPTKTKHQVAIAAERSSGAVMSVRVRSRVAPSMRPASSSSRWTAWKAEPSCW